MNDIKALSIYFTSELSSLLQIPVYNDIQNGITDTTYCVFFILDGEPTTYVYNNLAFNSFDVKISIWSYQWEFDLLQSVIDKFNNVQGVIISDDTDSGYINSIVYSRQDNMRDDNDLKWYGLQATFRVHTLPNM